MRLLITVLLVSLAVACSARPAAEDDYLYEDAEVPSTKAPTTKAPARGPVHGLRTGRGPSPLLASRGAKTTAAPVKPAEPEVVNEPEDIDDEGPLENEEVVAVTTEAPKKSLRSGMIVRPFRSNQDLLAALKRKRAQEHTSGGVATHPPTVTTPSPVEVKPNSKASSTRSNSNNNSSSGRRTFSRPNKATTAAAPEIAEEGDAPKKQSSFPSSNRRFSVNRGKPAPVTEDAEGDEVDEAPSRSAKSFRGGRRA